MGHAIVLDLTNPLDGTTSFINRLRLLQENYGSEFDNLSPEAISTYIINNLSRAGPGLIHPSYQRFKEDIQTLMRDMEGAFTTEKLLLCLEIELETLHQLHRQNVEWGFYVTDKPHQIEYLQSKSTQRIPRAPDQGTGKRKSGAQRRAQDVAVQDVDDPITQESNAN